MTPCINCINNNRLSNSIDLLLRALNRQSVAGGLFYCLLFVLCCGFFPPSILLAAPCDGLVGKKISKGLKSKFESAIAMQLQKKLSSEIGEYIEVSRISVVRLFKKYDWKIIYIEPSHEEPAYLFYKGDPLLSEYVLLWSGVTMHTAEEEAEIKVWLIENAKGIPDDLAACFAWYVTNPR